MGYGYGIWLVYDEDIFETKHTGHFTVACFMDYLDAVKLYDELKSICGDKARIDINGDPVIFSPGFYEHDDNNLVAWGYEGENKLWQKYAEICQKYKCDFSSIPHTSIEYSDIEQNQINTKKTEETTIYCKMHCVDITSNNPCEWNIII